MPRISSETLRIGVLKHYRRPDNRITFISGDLDRDSEKIQDGPIFTLHTPDGSASILTQTRLSRHQRLVDVLEHDDISGRKRGEVGSTYESIHISDRRYNPK